MNRWGHGSHYSHYVGRREGRQGGETFAGQEEWDAGQRLDVFVVVG